MKFRQLGKTGIQVSSICLGSMTWGEQNTEKEGHDQIDCAIDSGINFIDTSEVYPSPPVQETYGKTEEILGNWLTKRKDRDKLVIATKIAPFSKSLAFIRNGKNRLDLTNIELAVDASLKRLRTNYIDLFQIHWPERFTNYFGQLNYKHVPDKDGTPVSETLEALDSIVKSGKVRHIGICNESAWGVSEYLRLSEVKTYPRIVTIQNPYNLLNRLFEISLSEFSHREQVGLLAYSPLGFGVLTGKYLDAKKPDDSRLARHDTYKRYLGNNGILMTEKYVGLAREYELNPAQMALAFVLSRPFLTSVIIGASSVEQLKNNIASIELELPDEILKKIDLLHFEQPNPCP